MKRLITLFLGGCKNNDESNLNLSNNFTSIFSKSPNERELAMSNFYDELSKEKSYLSKGKKFKILQYKVAALSCLDRYEEIEQLLAENQFNNKIEYWTMQGFLYEKTGRNGNDHFREAIELLQKKQKKIIRKRNVDVSKSVYPAIVYLQLLVKQEIEPHPSYIDENIGILIESWSNMNREELLIESPFFIIVAYFSLYLRTPSKDG